MLVGNGEGEGVNVGVGVGVRVGVGIMEGEGRSVIVGLGVIVGMIVCVGAGVRGIIEDEGEGERDGKIDCVGKLGLIEKEGVSSIVASDVWESYRPYSPCWNNVPIITTATAKTTRNIEVFLRSSILPPLVDYKDDEK